MLFELKLAVWSFGATVAYLRRGRGFYIYIALFLVIFLVQGNVTDLAHYRQGFFINIYRAEPAFNWLQKLLQALVPNRDLAFELLKLSIPAITFYIFRRSLILFWPILFSQFMFLSVFNGLRQGLAAVLLLWLLLKLYGNRRYALPLWNEALAILMFSFAASLFHKSAIFVGILLALNSIIFRIQVGTNKILKSQYFKGVLIAFIVVAILIIFESVVSSLLPQYAGYFRAPTLQDQHVTRTNYVVKWALIGLYVFLTSRTFGFSECRRAPPRLATLRFQIFLICATLAFVFSYMEMATRIGFYFLAVDALYMAIIISRSTWLAPTGLVYVVATACSPSLLTILRMT